MASLFSSLLQWFTSLFFTKNAEIAIVGLQARFTRALFCASGKTSFVNVLGSGQWSEDVVPTVAFNLRKITKGNVTLKIWDVAGQPRYRSIWERYCSGVDAVVFVVDSVDKEKFETARFELHQLLAQPSLHGVPLLVLGNKNDIEGHAPVQELIKALQLDKITDRPVSCYSCSMKSQHNLDIVLQWLSGRGH
ncbi:Arl8a protein [Epithele typhae]|uniref:Arl8a protein n=1 Tax=Epithele typhae TaxID=378194 RepID=UPI0020087BF5|nr:Arl8a protein [Epithele typhae]KAH9922821.1 Arl8a protein [Epithele typhae]